VDWDRAWIYLSDLRSLAISRAAVSWHLNSIEVLCLGYAKIQDEIMLLTL